VVVHPKIKIVSSFTPPRVIPNLYYLLSFVEYKRRHFEQCTYNGSQV